MKPVLTPPPPFPFPAPPFTLCLLHDLIHTGCTTQVAEAVQAMLPGQLHYYETARMLVLHGAGKRKQPRLAGGGPGGLGLRWAVE